MRFRIPGTTVQARIFETVVTDDSQYTIVDCGLQHDDGSIDSLAVGGSFATARRWIDNANQRVDKNADAEMTAEVDTNAVENDRELTVVA